ncbi:MAG: TRAP transporter small permease [Alphaproteobacteria bacterium]|nr:TRAP transporter small permease [Alphaproteobacteria bacterium]MCA0449228.1 TRAP transporter small permease [Pseudomonadota bacterium]
MRRALDFIYDTSAWLAGLSMLAILVVTLIQVLGGVSDIFVRGTDAYAGYAMAAASFFALAHTLKRGEHIRVTLIIQRLPMATRRVMEIICLGVAVLMSGFFAWYAWDMVYWSWEFESRSDAMDASPLWIPQLAMSIGVTVLCVAFVDEFVQVLGGREIRESDLSADQQHTE